MTYCVASDLLVGDMTVADNTLESFIESAYEEITAGLGHVYVTPIDASGLAEHVQLVLKNINVLIASGRFILAQAVSTQDETSHAYGMSLLKEGQGKIQAIVNGQVQLTGVTRLVGSAEGTAPTIQNYDVASSVDAFYAETGYKGDVWRPGTLT